MSRYYAMNMAGLGVSQDKLENIPCPRFELLTHITTKTAQAGAILGAGLVGPCVTPAKGNRDCKSFQDSAFHYGKNGVMLGLLLGPALAIPRMRSMGYDGCKDRALMLRNNRKQCFVDRMSYLGLVAGLGAAKYCGEELAKGALFGFTGGCVMAGVINMIF